MSTTTIRRLPGLASMLDHTFDVVVACECGHTFVGRSVNPDPFGDEEFPVDHEIDCPRCEATTTVSRFAVEQANPIEIAAAEALGWLGAVIA